MPKIHINSIKPPVTPGAENIYEEISFDTERAVNIKGRQGCCDVTFSDGSTIHVPHSKEELEVIMMINFEVYGFQLYLNSCTHNLCEGDNNAKAE
jgi:hypothetical protein